MKYACLINQKYELNKYSLVPLREQDVFQIKKWRNEQMDILRQSKPLTDEEQLIYYKEKILPQFSVMTPEQILFSYLKEGVLIGYGGLTNIDWQSKKAEISFLLETSRTNDHQLHIREFRTFLTLVKTIAFDDLDLNRLYAETYDMRPHHVAALEECGFQFEGRMRQHAFKNGKYIDSLIHGCLKGDGGR